MKISTLIVGLSLLATALVFAPSAAAACVGGTGGWNYCAGTCSADGHGGVGVWYDGAVGKYEQCVYVEQ